jgi:hypothetical protein
MDNNKLTIVDGLVYKANGRLIGLPYEPSMNFISTINRDTGNLNVDILHMLPIDLVHVKAVVFGNGETILTNYQLVDMKLRGSDKDNINHYDYHVVDSDGNKSILSSPSMLLTMGQIKDKNTIALTAMYNKVVDERDRLKVENDFTIKLFQNIKLGGLHEKGT